MKKYKMRVGRRWLIIYSKNIISPSDLKKFKEIMGNPLNCSWIMFPSEYIEKVEVIGFWSLSTYIHQIALKIKRWLNK